MWHQHQQWLLMLRLFTCTAVASHRFSKYSRQDNTVTRDLLPSCLMLYHRRHSNLKPGTHLPLVELHVCRSTQEQGLHPLSEGRPFCHHRVTCPDCPLHASQDHTIRNTVRCWAWCSAWRLAQCGRAWVNGQQHRSPLCCHHTLELAVAPAASCSHRAEERRRKQLHQQAVSQ